MAIPLMRINSLNDPLLHNDKFIIKLDEKNLNIYRILSSYRKDISDLTKIYRLDRRCRNTVMRMLTKKFTTADKAAEVFLNHLEFYRKERYASKIKEKYRVKSNLNKGNITLEYARILSIILAKDAEDSIRIFKKLLLESDYLHVYNRQVKIPGDLNGATYLAGIICGDGHISKNLTATVIVDGHHSKELLKYSKKFLSNVGKIIMENFNLNSKLERENNYWIFRCCSTLLCRLMNYVYEIPSGNKCDQIRVASSIKNTRLENLFWRGVFDTDGCIRVKNKGVNLSTTSKFLFEDFIDFCKREPIVAFSSITESYGRKPKYEIRIAEESILKFANVVGISHPRKQNNLITYLKNGASYKIPVSKGTRNKFMNFINYLRPYKNDVLYIKLTKRREKADRKEIGRRLNMIEKKLKVKVIKVNRPERRNDIYYICSKELTKEVNRHYDFVPSLKPLGNDEIEKLRNGWSI